MMSNARIYALIGGLILLALLSPVFVYLFVAATACTGERREAFYEVEQFSPREPENPDPNPGIDGLQGTNGCSVSYEVPASSEEVEEYFLSEFREHGWTILRTPEGSKVGRHIEQRPDGTTVTGGSLTARKGDHYYSVSYLPGRSKSDTGARVWASLRTS